MQIIHGSVEHIIKESAEWFSLKTDTMLKTRKTLNIAVCGGRIVPLLSQELLKKDLHWKKLKFFMVDERAVSPDDLESNYKMWNIHLFDHLKSKGIGNLCEPVFNNNSDLNKNGKSLMNQIPEIHITLLSSGEDGHFASLFPNHPQLNQNHTGYIYEENSPKPPKKRVSFSVKTIDDSENIILFFVGQSKQEIFNKFIDGKPDNPEIPVSFLKNHDNLVVFTIV
jgi:6-phosphogluconolactonase